MSTDENERLEELWDEILVADLPAPELMARHAQSPNSLSAEERQIVDAALARSAAARDELDTLQSFDFSQLNADLEQPAESGIRSALRRLLFSPASFALVGGAAALLLWVATDPFAPLSSDETGNPNAPEPAFAAIEPDAPAPNSPSTAPGTGSSTDRTPAVESTEPQLAATGSQGLEPASSPRPSIRVAEPPTEGTPTRPSRAASADPAPEMLLAMNMPVYQRPSGAADRFFELGGFRSESPESALRIEALAPNHAARSLTPSPRLFWRLSEVPQGGAFTLDIVSTGSPQRVVAEGLAIPRPSQDGIQEIDLAGLGVTLGEDEEYRWSVAHRVDEWSPPTAFAFGWVVHAPAEAALSARLADASMGDRPAIFADSGYWYDALGESIDLMRSHPEQTQPGTAVQALLDQADLGRMQD
ncbi:MAG: hypothetical protein CL931_03285 [Deltaproteobacteria bacterium]|nr:hypothetical protein [Deltaproteobacteria bacterium]